MFQDLYYLTEIDGLKNINTSKVTNMSSMFFRAKSLTNLDLSSFDTRKVTDMSGMFCETSKLTNLNLSSFDTSNVIDMNDMFSGADKLTNLNLSSFNTKNVTDMSGMFSGTSSLTDLNLSNFNTENVANMSSMFSGASKLTNLNLSNFNTSKVTSMQTMFYGMNSLSSLNVSNFDTSNVTNMQQMFAQMSNTPTTGLKLDLSSFNTKNVEDMSSMFNSSQNIASLDISNFDDRKLYSANPEPNSSLYYIFLDNTSLSKIKVGENFKLSNAYIPADDYHNLKEGQINNNTWFSYNKDNENNPRLADLTKSVLVGDLFDGKAHQYAAVPGAPYEGSKTVNIKNNLDKDGTNVTIQDSISPEYINSYLYIDAPKKSGYTASPTKIKVTATANGLVASPDEITYTAIPHTSGGGSSSSGSTSNGNIKKSIQYVTVNPDIGHANLYTFSGKLVKNRGLDHDSDWYSDEIMTLKGDHYYRVATDEWVKTNNVHVYQNKNSVVETKDEPVTSLSTILGTKVTNRGLAKYTSWKSDRTVIIDRQLYYRVATGEYVSASDVNLIF